MKKYKEFLFESINIDKFKDFFIGFKNGGKNIALIPDDIKINYELYPNVEDVPDDLDGN